MLIFLLKTFNIPGKSQPIQFSGELLKAIIFLLHHHLLISAAGLVSNIIILPSLAFYKNTEQHKQTSGMDRGWDSVVC